MKFDLTEGAQFELDGRRVVAFEVAPLRFMAFAQISTDATRGKSGKDAAKALVRARIQRQCKAIDAEGGRIALSDAHIGRIPISIAMDLQERLNLACLEDAAGAPKLLSGDADGLTRPIHMVLGTPLKAKSSQHGELQITELEFRAGTLDEFEDLLVAETRYEQAQVLLSKAAPLGPKVNLQFLPGALIDQLSFMDGLFISGDEVLGRFFAAGGA